MPLSADPPPRLKVGILWDADCIASNAAAVVDVLRTLHNLAAMRSPPAPVLEWDWLALDASGIPCGGLPPAGGGGADGTGDRPEGGPDRTAGCGSGGGAGRAGGEHCGSPAGEAGEDGRDEGEEREGHVNLLCFHVDVVAFK